MPLEFDQIAATFEANQEEAAGAFSRSFGTEVTFAKVEADTLATEARLQRLSQPGLLLVAKADEVNAVFVLAEPSAILPDWYRSPDTTQNGVIQTLALEIGSLLVPESLEALDFKAIAVADVATALERAGLDDAASWVVFSANAGDESESLWLTWSCPDPDQLPDPVAEEEPAAAASGGETQDSEPGEDAAESESSLPPPDDFLQEASLNKQSTSDEVGSKVEQIDDLLKQAAEAQQAAAEMGHQERPLTPLSEFRRKLPSDFDAAIHFLPIYTKSLLRIRVPVVVNLATMKKSVSQVVELGLGSILQFDKACDEPLTLEVGGRRVAYGEVVKVGDKFGLRISSISLPPERFAKIRGLRHDSEQS